MLLKLLFCGILLMSSNVAASETFLTAPPSQPDLTKKYLFYLHGAIIERGELNPTHPQFGIYNMTSIRNALKQEENIVLISAQRAPKTNPREYSKQLALEIRQLLALGVSASNITIAGFSKGGGIAILTSSLMQHKDINYVFMASCNNRVFSNMDIKASGRVLSIFETSDNIGISCTPLMDRSPSVSQFKEIQLSTGKHHGAFYVPRAQWVNPLLNWVKGVDLGGLPQ